MAIDFIISLPTADIANVPVQSARISEYDNGVPTTAFLCTTDGTEPDFGVTAYVIGAWDREQPYEDGYVQFGETIDSEGVITGTPTYAINAEYTSFIRPLGNDDRRATGPLDSTHWQGAPRAKFLQDDDRYPDTNDPFILTITRDLSGVYPDWDNATTYAQNDNVMWEGQGYQSQQANNTGFEPGAPGSGPWWAQTEFGYGWIATMIEPSQSQDPITGYNIRVYPTAECVPGDQIYTSGNFADVGGGVFETRATSNNWTPTEEDVNIALIFVGAGNAQNGIITLPAGTDSVTASFWASNQGDVVAQVTVTAWAAGVSYIVGDQVTYNGDTYECILAHTSQSNKKPPNEPTLWVVI